MSLTLEAFHRGITPPASRTLSTYGLTQDEWIGLLKAQGWVCPICLQGNDRPKTGRQALWNTDHEHVKGWAKLPPEERKRHVRGILCYRCNHRVVGQHRDPAEVQRIADYLAAHRARLEGRPATGPAVAWAAGLFEGEGCIDIQRNGKYQYPRLQVAMTDEDVVRAFHLAVGEGHVHGPYANGRRGQDYKPRWVWKAVGNPARRVLAALLPHLGERRTARADEVVTECERRDA